MAHFKLKTEIELMCSFEKSQQLEFHYKSPPPVVVSFKERDRWEDDPTKGNAICTAITVQEMKPDVNSELHKSMDGNIVELSDIRLDTRDMIDKIFIRLRALSRSTVIMFNWTMG
jgi:hypothetical protein